VIPQDAIMLDDTFFLSEERRGHVLACLWALVRWWDVHNRPKTKERPLGCSERGRP